jgi:hypothetical protein
MKIEVGNVAPAPDPECPEIQRPQPPASEPDRDEKEYFEWRQELL